MFRYIYVISDIHGDFKGYESVFQQMLEDGLDFKQDLFVQLGDMIDGYPESYDVVQHLKKLKYHHWDNVDLLRGNHEQLAIDAYGQEFYRPEYQIWYQQGGAATRESYKGKLPRSIHGHIIYGGGTAFDSDVRMFNSLPHYVVTERFMFVHAGVRPDRDLHEQDEYDMLWIRDEFIESDKDFGKVVVAGHTAHEEPIYQKNKILLDTRWRGRGYVSGVRLNDNSEDYKDDLVEFRGPRR